MSGQKSYGVGDLPVAGPVHDSDTLAICQSPAGCFATDASVTLKGVSQSQLASYYQTKFTALAPLTYTGTGNFGLAIDSTLSVVAGQLHVVAGGGLIVPNSPLLGGTGTALTAVAVGAGLSLTGGTLSAPGGAGTVTSVTAAAPLTGGTITTTGTIGLGNVPPVNLNSGVNASATTFWRGDGTWATPAGGAPGGAVGNAQYFLNATTFGGSTGLTLSATAITAATMGLTGTAVGDLYYAGTGGVLTRLGASTSGYLLQTNGAGTAPTWVSVATGGGTVNGGTAPQAAYYATSTNAVSSNPNVTFQAGYTRLNYATTPANMPAWVTSAVLQASAPDGATRIAPIAFGGAARFDGVYGGTTSAGLAAPPSGTLLAGFGGWVNVGGASTNIVGGAGIAVVSAEAQSATNNGALLLFTSIPNTTTTPVSRMQLENDGGITLPPAVTGGSRGAGSINAQGLYVNNVAVLTGNQTITLSGDVSGSGTTAITTTLATVTVPKGGTGATTLPISDATPAIGSTGTVLLGQGTAAIATASANTTGMVGTFGGGNMIIAGIGTTNGGGYLSLFHANGTLAAPTALTSGQLLGSLFFQGFGATAWATAPRGTVQCYAAENWSNTAQGTYESFYTTQPTTVTTSERMRLGQGLMVGGTTDAGAGTLTVGTPTAAATPTAGDINGQRVLVNGVALGPGFSESVGWLAGSNPNTATIFVNDTGRTVTVVAISAIREAAEATGINVDVYKATSAQAMNSSATKLSTSSFSTGGTVPTVFAMLTGGTVTLAANDRIGVVCAAGTFTASVATITVYLQ